MHGGCVQGCTWLKFALPGSLCLCKRGLLGCQGRLLRTWTPFISSAGKQALLTGVQLTKCCQDMLIRTMLYLTRHTGCRPHVRMRRCKPARHSIISSQGSRAAPRRCFRTRDGMSDAAAGLLSLAALQAAASSRTAEQACSCQHMVHQFYYEVNLTG